MQIYVNRPVIRARYVDAPCELAAGCTRRINSYLFTRRLDLADVRVRTHMRKCVHVRRREIKPR